MTLSQSCPHSRKTRGQFNGRRAPIKLGIDVHQDNYVVAMQEGGTNPKPAQRFTKVGFLAWGAKLRLKHQQVHAVYEACGFGFGLQRQLSALGIECYVVSPQKLDERHQRVKSDLARCQGALLEVEPVCGRE